MTFKSISELAAKAPRTEAKGAKLTISTDVAHKRAGGEEAFSLRFGLSDELLKEARFIAGDRVDVLLDVEARLGLIRRTLQGGWKISGSKAKKVVQMTWTEGLPSVPTTSACESVTVTDEGIMFELPKTAQFGPCARK